MLEIRLLIKENLLELVSSTGDVSVRQELIPVCLLQAREVKYLNSEIVIFKDIRDVRIETKTEYEGEQAVKLTVIVKEKETNRAIKNIRSTLMKDNLKLESHLTDLTGKVSFKNSLFGNYVIEISNKKDKLDSILLDIKK